VWDSSWSDDGTEAATAEQEALDRLRAVLGELEPIDSHHLQEDVLVRFLRARDYDVKRAEKMVRTCLQWRKTYGTPFLRFQHVSHECTGKSPPPCFGSSPPAVVVSFACSCAP